MIETPTRCLNCGAALAPNARYCPECGRSSVPRRANPWPWIVGGLVGLAIIVLLVMLLRPPQSPPVTEGTPAAPKGPPVTQAPPPAPGPPVVAAPQPPVVQAPPPREDPNRAAVAAYLAKMAEIERRRKDIAKELMPAALSLFLTLQMKRQTGGDIEAILKSFDEDVTDEAKQQARSETDQQVLNTMEEYRNRLRNLAIEVQRIQPPQPAQRFHTGYLVSLGTYDATIKQLQDALVAQDASAVTRLSSLPQSLNRITSATDAELGRLLAQYRLMRTFSVSDDQQGGVLNITP